MAVTHILPSTALPGNSPKAGTAFKSGNVPAFENFLKSAVENANQTESETNAETLRIAAGESDSLHTLAINSAKAELALMTLVQVRNKALDAYNEIMRISL